MEFTSAIERNRHIDGELDEVVEAIIDRSGLIHCAKLSIPLRLMDVSRTFEFFGVAVEFDESHDDVEETQELTAAQRSWSAMHQMLPR